MNPEVTGSRPVSSDAEQQWIVRRARLHPHFLGSGGARSVKRSPHGFRRTPAFRPERLSSPPLHPVPHGTRLPYYFSSLYSVIKLPSLLHREFRLLYSAAVSHPLDPYHRDADRAPPPLLFGSVSFDGSYGRDRRKSGNCWT